MIKENSYTGISLEAEKFAFASYFSPAQVWLDGLTFDDIESVDWGSGY